LGGNCDLPSGKINSMNYTKKEKKKCSLYIGHIILEKSLFQTRETWMPEGMILEKNKFLPF